MKKKIYQIHQITWSEVDEAAQDFYYASIYRKKSSLDYEFAI